MPYISSQRREMLMPFLSALQSFRIDTAGELNYLITELCIRYRAEHGESYRVYNEIIGAIECAKLELYRRVVVPLEEQKIKEHGDVY